MTLYNIITLEKQVAALADELERVGIDPTQVTRYNKHPLIQRYITACKALTMAIYAC
jgi:hypothetical protein